MAMQSRAHWWGQVRYRRCAIYFGVLLAGGGYALVALWRDARAGAGGRRARRVCHSGAATPDNERDGGVAAGASSKPL